MNRRSTALPRVRVPTLRAMLASVTGEVDRLPSRKPVGKEIVDWLEPSPCPTSRRCVRRHADLLASIQGAVLPRKKRRR